MSPDFTVLQAHGFTDRIAAGLPVGTTPARVVRHDGHSVLAATPAGTHPIRIRPGLDPQPTVGDWLALRLAPGAAVTDAQVEAVMERSSLLRRSAADGSGPQVLAANIDVVLITCGADRPVRSGRIQRAATQAWDAGATPVLVLTKTAAVDLDVSRVELANPGLQVLATSAVEGVGLADLRDLLAGVTAVLIGESGAGKSTLANALLGRDEADVGSVREGDRKGRHTTTARALHLLPGPLGGAIIDTPGIRSLGLFTDPDQVDEAFPEIAALGGQCRFTDCRHRDEPGCAVLAAVSTGEIPAERYDSWRRLQREAANAALRASPHELRKHAKRFSRAARDAGARKARGG